MAYTYLRHNPSPPLDTYIDYLYYLNDHTYPSEKMLPMTTIHLVVSFGGAIRVFDSSRTTRCATLTDSWVIGTWSEAHIADWPPNLQFFGVCFKPGEAYPFLQLPLSELHNQFVPLDVFWSHYAAEMRERLQSAPTIQAGFELLERLLLARLAEAPYGLKAVRYGVAEIARQYGAVSIRELSEQIGISQSHLLTQFKRMVGISPKETACLARLEHVFHTIEPNHEVDWALLAQQCGYYDQAHLIRDFRLHLGHSPTDYLRLRRQAQRENPDRDRVLGRLPIE